MPTRIFIVRKPLELDFLKSLPPSGSPFLASAVSIVAGASAVTFNWADILDDEIVGYMLSNWSDLTNPMVTVELVHSDTTGFAAGSYSALLGDDESFGNGQNLNVDDFTLNTSQGNSNGLVTLALAEGAVTQDIEHDNNTRRLELRATLSADGP